MESGVEVVKNVTTVHGDVELRSDNILVFRPDIGTFKEYNLEILEELLEVFVKVTEGRPRPYMSDSRYITGIMTKEEQAYINENMGKFATSAAILTKSPLINLIVNSYNSVFKPKVKVKLFKNEQDAVEWLLKSTR